MKIFLNVPINLTKNLRHFARLTKLSNNLISLILMKLCNYFIISLIYVKNSTETFHHSSEYRK